MCGSRSTAACASDVLPPVDSTIYVTAAAEPRVAPRTLLAALLLVSIALFASESVGVKVAEVQSDTRDKPEALQRRDLP